MGAGLLRSSDSSQTKQIGTNSTPRKVALSIPPITPVPMARWLAAPAPLARARGITPRMNAMEVMMIGRKRRRAASMAASRRLCPCSQSSLANSTMRIAFFAERPMMVIRPTLKYTSLDIPLTITASTAPMAPIGTISITDSGIDQLS